MAIKVISPTELIVEQEIEWHIYDGAGRLLMKKGGRVHSRQQIDKLINLGAFYRINEAEPEVTEVVVNSALSPFEQVVEVLDYMEKLFIVIIHEPAHSKKRIPKKIFELSRSIILLCEYDLDAVIGFIHLDQEHDYAVKHPLHCAILCYVLALVKGIAGRRLNTIVCAAITSNLGMFELQRGELMAHQGPLTPEQRDEVDKHTMRSAVLLKRIGVMDKLWKEIVLQHHEKIDGTGYPRGLSGRKFILEARMLGLADRYSAMVSPREYRQGITPTLALKMLFKERGLEVDEKLGAVLIKEMGIYPPGSTVELANKELAVVTRRGQNVMKPIVKSVFACEGGNRYPIPIAHDSGGLLHGIAGLVELSPNYVFDVFELWDYSR